MSFVENNRYCLIKKIYLGVLGLVVVLAFLLSLLNTGASGRLDKNLDYGRFLSDLDRISSETHYIRSPGHAGLQDWLESRIREIGEGSSHFELQVDEFDDYLLFDLPKIAAIQRKLGVGEYAHYDINELYDEDGNAIFIKVPQAPLKNFIVTVRGVNQSGKALMIVSHYDGVGRRDESGAVYPSTTDAGIHVAAILEVLRYAVNNPVENDVIFLITDGEEAGLLGARHYMENLEDSTEKIGLAANFEATGTSGTLVMFETGNRAAGTIRSFAKAIGTVYSNSLAEWMYETMPNSTDMAVFKKHGLAGLNFACAGQGQHYHTPDDNMENLNEALAKQTLNTVLSMYTNYGNYNFDRIAGDEKLVYFSFYHWGLVILPVWAVYLSIGFMTACFAAAVAMKRNDFSGEFFKRNILKHFKTADVTLRSFVIAIGFTYLIARVLNMTTGVWLANKHSTFGIAFGTMLIAMVLFTAVQFFFCRLYKVTKYDAFVFAAIWQFLPTVVLAFVLPEASFMFLLPAFFSVMALALETTVRNKTAVTIIKDLHLPVLSAALAFTTTVTMSILTIYALGTRIAPIATILPLFPLCAFPALLGNKHEKERFTTCRI